MNVTVRDIPHWMNPPRVEVSDEGHLLVAKEKGNAIADVCVLAPLEFILCGSDLI